MVDDDLAGEAAADGVVRERLLHSGLDGADGFAAAVVVAGAEADDQQLVFADFVLIERIIQACVTRFVVLIVVCRGIGCSGVRALGVLGGVVCSRLAAAGGQSRHHQARGEQQSAQFLEFHEKVPPFFRLLRQAHRGKALKRAQKTQRPSAARAKRDCRNAMRHQYSQ